jgi:hypothetical protein
MIIRVPAIFWDDHADRYPPIGVEGWQELRRTQRTVTVELNREAFENLLSDAEHYSSKWGPDDCPRKCQGPSYSPPPGSGRFPTPRSLWAIPAQEVIHTGPPAGHWNPAERALVDNPQRACERLHGGRRLRWPNEWSCSSAGTRYRLADANSFRGV